MCPFKFTLRVGTYYKNDFPFGELMFHSFLGINNVFLVQSHDIEVGQNIEIVCVLSATGEFRGRRPQPPLFSIFFPLETFPFLVFKIFFHPHTFTTPIALLVSKSF